MDKKYLKYIFTEFLKNPTDENLASVVRGSVAYQSDKLLKDQDLDPAKPVKEIKEKKEEKWKFPHWMSENRKKEFYQLVEMLKCCGYSVSDYYSTNRSESHKAWRVKHLESGIVCGLWLSQSEWSFGWLKFNEKTASLPELPEPFQMDLYEWASDNDIILDEDYQD